MINTSKSVVLSGVAACALVATMAGAFLKGAASVGDSESYEGYFAPVYSPDGKHVYFVERSTSGTVVQTRPPDLLFGAPRFDVFVDKDRFTLKRLHLETRKIEEISHLPPSPIEGQRYEAIGSAFQVPDARLKFTENQQLEFNACLTVHNVPRAQSYFSSGVWTEAKGAAVVPDPWKKSHCEMSGYDEWPLSGDWELIEMPHGQHFVSPAILAYNHVTRDARVLVKNKLYDQLYPDGVPLQQIAKNSRRPGIERNQAVSRAHKELMQKYKAMGMSEYEASLRTGKDMQRLGYYPKSSTIVARRLSREEASRTKHERDAVFSIARGEMGAGIFPDIAQAIAHPGEEIEKDFTEYVTHRDYSTSARLNAFIKSGKTRFYVRLLGETYELKITRP